MLISCSGAHARPILEPALASGLPTPISAPGWCCGTPGVPSDDLDYFHFGNSDSCERNTLTRHVTGKWASSL